jgi:hypothetical protein
MATSGDMSAGVENRWPPLGRNRWPLTPTPTVNIEPAPRPASAIRAAGECSSALWHATTDAGITPGMESTSGSRRLGLCSQAISRWQRAARGSHLSSVTATAAADRT